MAGRAGAAVLGLTLGVLWSAAVVGPLWTVLWGAALLAHRDARDWLGRGGALWLVGGILAALVVLWPAAFTKVSLLQTYGLRLYAVLFQGGREWGGAAAALGGFVRQSPALLAYALLGLFACAVGLARGHRDALACGAAAVAFMVVILPFAIIDRYLLPLLPLAVLSAVALASPGDPERAPAQGRRARWTPPLVVAGVVACWALGAGFQYPQREWSEALRREYARVATVARGGTEVLAEGGHIFRFYGGASTLRPVLVNYDGRHLLLRDGVRYDTVSPDRSAMVVLQRRGRPLTAAIRPRRRLPEDGATRSHPPPAERRPAARIRARAWGEGLSTGWREAREGSGAAR